MPFPQVEHHLVSVSNPPPSAPEPVPGGRMWIGRVEPDGPRHMSALWNYSLDLKRDASRYWILLTVGEPYTFRVQFLGREGSNQEATVRDDAGALLRRLPMWDGHRDSYGLPIDRQAFLNRAPSVEISDMGEISIVAEMEHEIRVKWSKAEEAEQRRVPPSQTPTPWTGSSISRIELHNMTGWTMNQIDFFIVDAAAARACGHNLSGKELNRIHDIAAQRPPLSNRRPVGLGRPQNTRTEMIRRLNDELRKDGQPEIPKGAGVKGLQRWASEFLGGLESACGIDPPLYTATVNIVSSREYLS